MNSTPAHVVQITRLTLKHRKYKRGGGSSLQRAYVAAFVDGYLVTRPAGKAWRCSCLVDGCSHPAAVAAVLAPDVLAQFEDDGTEDKQ